MRILFATTPGVGHVQPVIPLAQAAAGAGHDVRWVTGPDAAVLVEAAGVRTTVVGAAAPDRASELAQRYPEVATVVGPARAEFMFPRLFGEIGAGSVFPGLLELARDWRPDVIVHEQAELAAPIVAEALGVPNACHSYGLALPAMRVEQAGAFTSTLWEAVGLEPRPFGGCYDHLYIDIAPPSLQPGPLPHLGRRVHRRPRGADATVQDTVPTAIRDVLACDRPVVYLTFGTVFNVDPVFATIVHALATLDAEVIVTIGPGGDPDVGPLPRNVHVERYLPQSLLFEHVDVVVSHAGSGTFLGALAAGIPQLCLPQAADQFQNAAAAELVGAGLALRGAEVTTPALLDAVSRLLHDDGFGRRARAVATEIETMPEAAEVVRALEALGG